MARHKAKSPIANVRIVMTFIGRDTRQFYWWRKKIESWLTALHHSGLGSIWIRTGLTLVPASVMCGKYRPDHILCRLGFNFDGAARLFTVPGLSMADFTYPTRLVQCDMNCLRNSNIFVIKALYDLWTINLHLWSSVCAAFIKAFKHFFSTHIWLNTLNYKKNQVRYDSLDPILDQGKYLSLLYNLQVNSYNYNSTQYTFQHTGSTYSAVHSTFSRTWVVHIVHFTVHL